MKKTPDSSFNEGFETKQDTTLQNRRIASHYRKQPRKMNWLIRKRLEIQNQQSSDERGKNTAFINLEQLRKLIKITLKKCHYTESEIPRFLLSCNFFYQI